MKTCKKLLAITIALVLLVSTLVSGLVVSAADATTTLAIGTTTIKEGTTTADVEFVLTFAAPTKTPHSLCTITAADGLTLTAIEVDQAKTKYVKQGEDGQWVDDELITDEEAKVTIDNDGKNLAAGKVLVESAADSKAPTVTFITFVATFAVAEGLAEGTYAVSAEADATNWSEDDIAVTVKSGAVVVEAAVVEPDRLSIYGISRAKSLSLKDVVYVNPTVAFVDVVDGKNVNVEALEKNYVLENGKILFWDTNPGDNAVIGTETADSSLEDAGTYSDTNDAEEIQEYKGKSMGIPAKNFGDTIYYRTYIVVDGEEYYGDVIEYSVQTYCYNQINSSRTTAAQNKLRALCATMLNFGSSAQIQLSYNQDNLSNSILPGLVESGKLDAQYLEQNWDGSLLVAAQTPAADMTVNFAVNNASITAKTLQLKGAIEPKITMGYKLSGNFATQLPADADLKFYFWTSEQYDALAAAGKPLAKYNASTIKTFGVVDENDVAEVELSYSKTYGYEYFAKPDAISARNLSQTFYFAAVVTEADGTEYCTGVNSYSPIQYAINQINKTSAAESLKDLCRWMALYGDAAKTYLG